MGGEPVTGCAFCGMKGFRVCDQCQARGEAINADIKAGIAAWAGEGVPKSFLVLGVDRSVTPHRFSPDYVPEPEPVELTVEDVLAFAQGLLDDPERPFNDRKVELERRTHGWTLYNDRDGSRWPADLPAELRDVVIYAKKGGLL
jgi:hypothetical protein